MPTTNGNRKILDLKRWEFCTPSPVNTAAGSFIASSRHYRQQQLFVQAQTVAYLYNPNEDGWIQIPSPAYTTAVAAGACGTAACWSTGTTVGASQLTATGGTTSTIITNQTIARDLRGYSVHITGGPNNGQTLEILSNTTGANAVLRVATQGSAFTASTTYRLLTPVWYTLNGGTVAAAQWRKYCFATNTWTSLTTTGLPASVGTDARLIATPSWIDTTYKAFGSGTATSGGATTLTDSGKSWTTNQWTNYQVRIVSGTGAGQIRTISSNTSTALTVPTWGTNPDATSVYSIEGNDDFIYLIGAGAVTLYRYSISGNSWSTLSPGAARSGAPSTGMSGHWIWGATDSAWTSESAIINGRRIYSFRGGAGAILDYYDIAANTWTSNITYAPKTETFTTGTKYVYIGDYLYMQKDATGRWFRYNIVTSQMDGWNTMLYPNGAALLGDTAFDVHYHDGETDIDYIHMLLNTSAVHLRQMVI